MRRVGNKILVCVALFGILFLTGSANAAVDFPADEAGISAYVKAKASIPNLDVVKPVLATIERENITAGYIIGTVAMDYHTEEQYPHVYVSTDGWVVAYYPNDRSSGWLLPWYYYTGGPISTTTLKETVVKVCTQIGGTTTGLKYYDFRHPDATKMMIIVESTPAGGSNWFKVTIPSNYTTYRTDWSHYASSKYWSYAYLDGAQFSQVNWNYNSNHANYGSFAPSVEFANGVEHKIDISAKGYYGRVGLVLEYAE